jgi:hypothetical protein
MLKTGPKSKYEIYVQPRIETIKAWRRCGLTDEEICANLQIGHSAFYMYKSRYSEFSDALRMATDDSNAQVVNALFKRCIGYEFEEKKIIQEVDANGTITGKRVEVTKKQIGPDVGAIIFYLKNRYSSLWRNIIPEGEAGVPLPASNGPYIGEMNVTQIIGEGKVDADEIRSKARDILLKSAGRFGFRLVEPPGPAN